MPHWPSNIMKTFVHAKPTMTLAQLLTDEFPESIPDYEMDQKS